MTESSTISIPTAMYQHLKALVDSSGGAFASVDEYAAFLLGETLKEMKVTEGLSGADEKEVQDRLKRLGYV